MSNLKFAFLSLIVSFVFISCQRDPVSPNPQSGGNGGASSYNPTTVGSWWKYKDSTTGGLSTTTIASRTKTINGILYAAMVSEIPSQDTAWVSSAQPNYYTYAKGVSPNTGASYDILFHYLNDTASVGYTWRYTAGQGNGFTAYIRTTILERNISMTVAGKSYNNVIHTKVLWTYDVMGTLMDAMLYDYFIAKGVGIIKVRSEGLTLLAGFKGCSDLTDYGIK